MYWYHPAWNLLLIPLLFVSWPIALIIALVVRKAIPVHPTFCPQHQKQMRWLFRIVPSIVLILLLLPLTALFIPSLSNYFSSTFIAMWYFSIIAFCLIFAPAPASGENYRRIQHPQRLRPELSRHPAGRIRTQQSPLKHNNHLATYSQFLGSLSPAEGYLTSKRPPETSGSLFFIHTINSYSASPSACVCGCG